MTRSVAYRPLLVKIAAGVQPRHFSVVAQFSQTVGGASVLASRKAKDPSDQRLAGSLAPANYTTTHFPAASCLTGRDALPRVRPRPEIRASSRGTSALTRTQLQTSGKRTIRGGSENQPAESLSQSGWIQLRRRGGRGQGDGRLKVCPGRSRRGSRPGLAAKSDSSLTPVLRAIE